MNLNSIFTNGLPHLDLHGYDRETARVAINDFINDNRKLKNDKFVIIHGIGSGILRKTTLDTLKRNKIVLQYSINFFNAGSTIVHIKV